VNNLPIKDRVVAEKDDYLVDILVDLGFVSPEKVEELRTEAQSAGVGLVDLMLANGVVRQADVTQAKAAHLTASSSASPTTPKPPT